MWSKSLLQSEWEDAGLTSLSLSLGCVDSYPLPGDSETAAATPAPTPSPTPAPSPPPTPTPFSFRYPVVVEKKAVSSRMRIVFLVGLEGEGYRDMD